MKPMTSKPNIPPGESEVCQKAVPGRAIYALNLSSGRAQSAKVILRRPSGRRALVKIVRVTFNDDVTEPERLKNQFLVSREPASRVAVKAITDPRTLRALWPARDAILAARAHV